MASRVETHFGSVGEMKPMSGISSSEASSTSLPSYCTKACSSSFHPLSWMAR